MSEDINKFEDKNINDEFYNDKINIKLYREPTPRYIKDIFREFNIDKKINLRPEFQRNFIWSVSKQKELIKSLYSGIPLPMFYFAESDENDLEVIDGQQRLTTIFGFLDKNSLDKETRKKLFKVIKLKENGNEIKNNVIKSAVFNSKIYCVDVPKTNLNAKYEIFQVLNQGATVLKPQEIRNSIFSLKMPFLNNSLKSLGKKIRRLVNMKLERMSGEELAYRFYIIYKYGYESDPQIFMKNIDKVSKEFDNNVIKDIKRKANRFILIMKRLFGHDLNQCFQVLSKNQKPPKNNIWKQHFFSGTINQGLFQLFSFYLPKYNNNQINKVNSTKFKNNLLQLLKNKKFISVITGSGTNSKKNIQKSKELFEKYFLFKTFGNWTKKEPRSVSRTVIKSVVRNIPFCYLSYKSLKSVSSNKISAEHIDSFNSGSDTKLSNILPAYKIYNNQKRAMNLEEYRQTDRSIKIRRRNKNNITEYLECLKKWNRTYPLDKYRLLRKYALKDKKYL